jgi:hypothetical protein
MGVPARYSRSLLGLAVLGAAVLLSVSAGHAQTAPFAGMAGIWSGGGVIELDSGSQERIRCRATYAVSNDGNGLNQTLVCASDSYKFDLRSNVVAQNGVLSGTWSEAGRGVSGNLEGRAGGGRFNVVVSAPAFTANVTLTTHGNSQTVSISSQGQIKGAKITLSRS